MGFDFSKAITRETNTLVNKAISSTMKTVGTSVNKGAGDFVKKNVEGLLNKIGAPPAIRQAVRNIQADIVENAVKSATGLVQDIISGAFNGDSLKKLTSMDAVKAALKGKNPSAQQIHDINVLAGVANKVTNRVSTPGVVTKGDSSPYAVDFADNFTPKFKFLFLAEIVFNAPFNAGTKFGSTNKLHTVIHKFDRPKIDIDHEEVNMYNFTTHVPKLVKYSPASFTAHDDETNHTLGTLVSYLKIISPTLNSHDTGGTSYDYAENALQDGPHGANSTRKNSSNFATIQQSFEMINETQANGAQENLTSIIKEIKIYHVYDFGARIDIYRFFNPKFTSIEMDGLDMSENATTSVKFEFVYDAMHIDVGLGPNDKAITKFTELNNTAKHNITNRNIEVARQAADNNAKFDEAYNTQQAEIDKEESRIRETRKNVIAETAQQRAVDFQTFVLDREQVEGIDPSDEYERARTIELYNAKKEHEKSITEYARVAQVSINQQMLAQDLNVAYGPVNVGASQSKVIDAKLKEMVLKNYTENAASLPSAPTSEAMNGLLAKIQGYTEESYRS